MNGDIVQVIECLQGFTELWVKFSVLHKPDVGPMLLTGEVEEDDQNVKAVSSCCLH